VTPTALPSRYPTFALPRVTTREGKLVSLLLLTKSLARFRQATSGLNQQHQHHPTTPISPSSRYRLFLDQVTEDNVKLNSLHHRLVNSQLFRMFNTPTTGSGGFIVVDTVKDNVKLLFTGAGNFNG
jgi:hypothetical protein